MPEPAETDPLLELELQLDPTAVNWQTTEHGIEFDRFFNLYNHLPERRVVGLMGGDIRLELEGDELLIRPVAVYDNSLIVSSLGSESEQDQARLYLLKGSFLCPKEDRDKLGPAVTAQTIALLAKQGKRITEVREGGMRVVYSPGTLCREANLVYTEIVPLESLQTDDMRARTALNPLIGYVITVQPQPNQPLTLFVEDSFRVSPLIKNAYWQVGNKSQPLLSYVK